MTALVVVETVVLALMALLVAGLLRSHAEILRRLEAMTQGREDLPVPRPRGAVEPDAAPDLVGTTLAGEPLKVGVGSGQNTLLAFLTSGCSVCGGLWRELHSDPPPEIPGHARLILVTKDSSHESPSKLLRLAPEEFPVVMSSPAWEDYAIPAAPYFVFVDGATGRVHGEGVASTWEQVSSLLEDALLEQGSGLGHGSRDRALRAEVELKAAGIEPGDPSLYGESKQERAA